MVSAQVKAQTGANRVTKVGNGMSFQVYLEKEKVKVDAISTSKRASGHLDKGPKMTTSSDAKGLLKFAEKGSKDKSVRSANPDLKVRRNALVDVTNAQSSFRRNNKCDGSNTLLPLGSESGAVKYSLRKCTISMGRKNTSQRMSDFCSTRKGVKDFSGSSENKKTNVKNPSCGFAVKNQRSPRNSLVSMRKSRSVLVAANQRDTIKLKINHEGLEKAKRNSGLSGKVKISEAALPQVSTRRSCIRTNGVSDGFLTRNQTDANPHGRSRKVNVPALKTAVNASNARRTSRSKFTSAANKSIITVALSSGRKEESVTSHSNHIPPVIVSHEAAQEPPADSNNNLTTEKSDFVVRRKSDRRKSYTSTLIAGTKLLQEHDKFIDQKRVPCIDDNYNQLEVAEYVDEIYQFYWVSETQDISQANYMSNQMDITPQMRGILINWLIEVHLKYVLMHESLYLLVKVLDQFLSQVQIRKVDMQLVGLTSLLLASKYEDYWAPRVKDLLSISAEEYTRAQMLVMEKEILKTLKFRLNAPTPYVFMLRFLKAAQSDVESMLCRSKLKHLAFYLIELCLVEYEALRFRPSLLCAAAIYVARSTLQIAPHWTPLLVKHARYEVSEIRECAKMILRFQKGAAKSHLKVTYEKYMRPDFGSVAALKPLDELPF